MTVEPSGTLRRMREAAGLSLRDLERLTGINRGRLSDLERVMVPTDDETAKILEALRNAPRKPSEPEGAPA